MAVDFRAIAALASSLPIESVSQFVKDDLRLAEGDHIVAALAPGRPGRSEPRLRFQNKTVADGNTLCNVCGPLVQILLTN